jgi:hypothetical protein
MFTCLEINMKDLFGQEIPETRDDVELTVQQRDKATFKARSARLRYIENMYSGGYEFLTSPDTHYLFRELQAAFVDGSFVACILLSQAFVERLLEDRLVGRSLNGSGESLGLTALIAEIRAKKLMHPFLIEKIERLNKKHTPFVHLKDFDYPYGINEHSYKNGTHTEVALEDEAKETLGLVFKVLFTDLTPR